MPTKHIQTIKKRQANRPGLMLLRARKYAKITMAVFFAVLAIGIGMILIGFDVPGLAFIPRES